HRFHNAVELSQQSIASVLDNPATALSDFRIDEGAQVVREPNVRSFFVQASQATVACHVGCQDGCEPSFHALGGQGCLRSLVHDTSGSSCHIVNGEAGTY